MNEPELPQKLITSWFVPIFNTPYVFIRVRADQVSKWIEELGPSFRRCYASDAFLLARAEEIGESCETVINALIPNPGSVMTGDFGEILVYFYHSILGLPNVTIGPKKWQLKQDRTKAAPYSDVIHFCFPQWPTPSTQDKIFCSEVKTKSTVSKFAPITKAIEHSKKDRSERLAETLVWLRDRAIKENIENVEIKHLNRFIKADLNPTYQTQYNAVAIVCESLLEKELKDLPVFPVPDHTLVIISVPELKKTYTAVYAAVCASTVSEDGESE